VFCQTLRFSNNFIPLLTQFNEKQYFNDNFNRKQSFNYLLDVKDSGLMNTPDGVLLQVNDSCFAKSNKPPKSKGRLK